MYKEELDKHLPPEWSQVVVSSAGKKDPETLRRHQLSEEEEIRVRKAFRRPISERDWEKELAKYKDLRILIVTEKLLTGFDTPILYCMYLDKPMRDHVLLQAIARVNRPYEDNEGRRKTCGFVLDFVGIFDKLEKALAFDSQDVSGVIDDIGVLKTRFEEQMGHGQKEYLPIPAGKSGDKAVEAILEHFRDKDRRDEFYGYFRELEELHEIISPDKFMHPFLKDYSRLADMYWIVRSCYDRGVIIDKSFLRKTAQLVREHTETSGIREPTKIHKLDADILQAIADDDKPDTVKVFNLLKAFDQLARDQATSEPYLIGIGDKAQEIAQAFEQRQQTTQVTLEQQRRLIEVYRKARQERDMSRLSPEAFAVGWYLRQNGVEKADEVARATEEAFQKYPHWQTSGHQEQEVRKSFYKALINAGVDGVVELAQSILKMLRRAGQ
jgi:type I restriction enzyme R subunit